MTHTLLCSEWKRKERVTELSISQKVSNLFNAQTEWGARSLNALLQNIHTYLHCMCSRNYAESQWVSIGISCLTWISKLASALKWHVTSNSPLKLLALEERMAFPLGHTVRMRNLVMRTFAGVLLVAHQAKSNVLFSR